MHFWVCRFLGLYCVQRAIYLQYFYAPECYGIRLQYDKVNRHWFCWDTSTVQKTTPNFHRPVAADRRMNRVFLFLITVFAKHLQAYPVRWDVLWRRTSRLLSHSLLPGYPDKKTSGHRLTFYYVSSRKTMERSLSLPESCSEGVHALLHPSYYGMLINNVRSPTAWYTHWQRIAPSFPENVSKCLLAISPYPFPKTSIGRSVPGRYLFLGGWLKWCLLFYVRKDPGGSVNPRMPSCWCRKWFVRYWKRPHRSAWFQESWRNNHWLPDSHFLFEFPRFGVAPFLI